MNGSGDERGPPAGRPTFAASYPRFIHWGVAKCTLSETLYPQQTLDTKLPGKETTNWPLCCTVRCTLMPSRERTSGEI